MPITKLTRDLLPAFIFLTDLIIEDDGYSPDFKNMMIESESLGFDVSMVTFRRAFQLREQLQSDTLLGREVYLPKIEVLNALTRYYYHSNPDSFKEFIKLNRVEIDAHYKNHTPQSDVVDFVFLNKKTQKELLERKLKEMERLKEELQETTLNNFLKEVSPKTQEKLSKIGPPETVKNDLIVHLQQEIKRTKKAIKRLRIFFGMTVFWFSKEELVDVKEFVVNSYIENQEGLEAGAEEEDEMDDDLWDLLT